MRPLAKLFLSLEKLVQNPVLWYTNRNWVTQLVLVFFLIPLISATSIFFYEAIGPQSEEKLQSIITHRDQELLQQIAKNHQDELQEIAHLNEQVLQLKTQVSLISGDETLASDVIPNLVLGETTSDSSIATPSNEEDKNFIYVPTRSQPILVHEQAIISSSSIATLKQDAIYEVLQETPEWYKIDYGDTNQAGWVQSELVVELP